MAVISALVLLLTRALILIMWYIAWSGFDLGAVSVWLCLLGRATWRATGLVVTSNHCQSGAQVLCRRKTKMRREVLFDGESEKTAGRYEFAVVADTAGRRSIAAAAVVVGGFAGDGLVAAGPDI